MSKAPFTDEQMKLLRDNPYTFRVTPSTLYLTKEFKALFYEEYQSGKIPRCILEEHGYPAAILDNQRIWGSYTARKIPYYMIRPNRPLL